MKLLFLSHHWSNNSHHSQHSGFQRLVGFAAEQHDVTLVTWGNSARDYVEGGIRVVTVKSGRRDFLFRKRIAISRKAASLAPAFDAIHALYEDCTFALPKDRFTATFHVLPGVVEYPEWKQRIFIFLKHNILQRRALRNATNIACVSTNLMAAVPDRFLLKTRFIPHGIDTDFWDPAKASATPTSAATPNYILCVGSHGLNRRLLTGFIRANPDRQFIIVGLRTRLEPLSNIRYLDNISDEELRDLYAGAALMIRPLDFATANNSILEALSMGKTIVAGRIPGITDYLTDETAIFIDTLPDLSLNRIKPLDPSRIRELAINRFSWRKVLTEYSRSCTTNKKEMPKKRIAVIGLKGLPPYGGAASVGDNIIEQLAKEYDFTIYATETHTHHKGDYKGAHQIVFRQFPIKKLNVFFYYIASAIRATFGRRYDAIHLHHMDAAFILLLLRLRYKVISTSHGITYRNSKWSKWSLPYFKLNEWLQSKLSNHLTVVSKSLVPHYGKIVASHRVTYIPNGVTHIAPAELPTGDSDYVLFAAGRILPIKGLHTLLSAMHRLKYKGKIIVLGDCSQRNDYKAEIFELAAGLNVEFKGLIKEKPILNAWIAGARLFVFPSTIEAMSMMLLEVASLRTPVVCSDIVQNTDIFEPDEMLFFRTASDTDLAEKLSWALAHPEEMKQFAEKAYRSLAEKYQWTIIARQYADVFDRITTRSGRPRRPQA